MLTYQLPDIKVSNYQNPYVAIWISDHRLNTVRTLLLLGESERWAVKLSRWWRLSGRKQSDQIDGYAAPPGALVAIGSAGTAAMISALPYPRAITCYTWKLHVNTAAETTRQSNLPFP